MRTQTYNFEVISQHRAPSVSRQITRKKSHEIYAYFMQNNIATDLMKCSENDQSIFAVETTNPYKLFMKTCHFVLFLAAEMRITTTVSRIMSLLCGLHAIYSSKDINKIIGKIKHNLKLNKIKLPSFGKSYFIENLLIFITYLPQP